jgi:hypothetical protein
MLRPALSLVFTPPPSPSSRVRCPVQSIGYHCTRIEREDIRLDAIRASFIGLSVLALLIAVGRAMKAVINDTVQLNGPITIEHDGDSIAFAFSPIIVSETIGVGKAVRGRYQASLTSLL